MTKASAPAESVADAGEVVADTIARIAAPRDDVRRRVEALLDQKTKPRGSLGRLEELACRIGAIRNEVPTRRLRAAVVVAAGDHGVAAHGVSAYPQNVTWSTASASPTT